MLFLSLSFTLSLLVWEEPYQVKLAMASSLVLPSLSPKAPAFSITKNPSICLFSSSLSLTNSQNKPISVSSSSPYQILSSRFVPKVAVSSEFEQEEEVLSDGGEAPFSPDLKLFVGNLPFSVDSAGLAGLFEQAGNVEMVEVIYDKQTGRSRGFGFVTMSTVEEVEAAVQQFNGYELEGRAIRVNSGPPPRKEEFSSRGSRGGTSFEAPHRVYVGNLSWGVDDLALESLFSEQGKVMEAKVVYDRQSGRSKGFGFVTYSSAEDVDNAISSLDGADLNGRPIRVSVAEARPRRQF
ncbi:PREDICTED: 29 kDa ribonucleoprotein A, chloroplastic-like [Nelumbo nucifera]|uniref:29 kDa ribonucleoprotein A, chloroplastic-like n=1 Tax=Nelumbo nucifera TaxID=4432 RepID=A0A1U7ZYI6_NELNU|nr:PREDICTED: 29 kDa ribonucleoprotein A, chloroplastic-like [Nelumbo nucifera]